MSDPDQREEAIVRTALLMPAEQRAAYLEKACAGDTALRKRVASRLAAPSPAATATDDETVAVSDATQTNSTVEISGVFHREEAPGDTIGRYKLLEQIGEGGFGTVYIAEQKEPVKRRVALKIIKLGMDTKQVVARFEAERQALALMDHPNIARVLDAGATETGRPFFVMELVRGIRITDYCDQNKLATRKRLDLFIAVCRAIEHAHQKGVIHRDIKPSNILVTLHDGLPVPKVIDFGIAKATQGNLTDKTVYTQADQFIGTPAYMSPEQANMGGLDIDTRSDIYSLGVLLYELLTAQTPFESKNLLARGFDEMRRMLREIEPQLPSLRLGTQKASDQTSTASRHGTDAPKLINLVRGDLDWVVMKCLEKDRSRRYDSASDLAADVQRFLNNEPVTARPPTTLYRFRKMVRRNRLAFAAGSAVFAALVMGLAVSTWFVIKEKQQRELAETSSKVADRDRQTAEAARQQSEVERQRAEAARQRAEAALQQAQADRAKALAAEKQARDSEAEAQASRRQAETALHQAQADRAKAEAAEKEARDSQSQAASARQEAVTALKHAEAAQTRADSEASKSEQAIKAVAAEVTLRRQAEAARQQAEVVTAAAAAQSTWLGGAFSNLLAGLDAVPPADALSAVAAISTPADGHQPWAAQMLRARGLWHARHGDWSNAIADFSAWSELEPANPLPCHFLAPLLAQSGDAPAYARNCARSLAQFASTNPPAWMARDCLLGAAPGIDLAAVTALAGKAIPTATNEVPALASQLTLGLAHYRLGHWTDAAAWAAKALAGAKEDPYCAPQACAVLAMTQQQLGQTNLARATLAAGRQIMEAKLPKLEGGDIGPDWNDWIAAHTLAKEAGDLIDTAPKAE